MVEEKQTDQNLVKVREDRDPVRLSSCANGTFRILSTTGWKKGEGEMLASIQELRKRVEPWLTALFQSEHLSLLVGTGLTAGACAVVKKESRADEIDGCKTRGMEVEERAFTNFGEEIDKVAEETAEDLGRGKRNFEDVIRVANELVRGLQILGRNEEAESLDSEIRKKLNALAKDLLANEKVLRDDGDGESWKLLGNFLMSFAARSGGKDRLNLFTTNYDRVLEETADVIGLRLVDRFVGTLAPVFRSSRLDVDYHYNPPGIRGEPRYLEGVVRFTKLHGSLDWFKCGGLIRRLGVPFGAFEVAPYLENGDSSNKHELIIYPNSAKDRETAEYPYVDLFRDFAAAICRPNSTLVTYGYGFGDSHINRIIEDALTIASTHLVILSYDNADGRICSFYEKSRAKSQISLLVGKDVASLEALTGHYLPKSAIDTATDRMAKMLADRHGLDVESDHSAPGGND